MNALIKRAAPDAPLTPEIHLCRSPRMQIATRVERVAVAGGSGRDS
jgi:hypothetical protein